MQNDPFETLDALYEENPREFEWILKEWWGLNSYSECRQLLSEKRQKLQGKRAKRAKADISKAERRPVSIKKAEQKEVKPLLQSKPALIFVNWSMWLQKEREIGELWQHQGRKLWREQLKVELKRAIREGFPTCWKKAMDKWGIDKVHNELYRLCVLCARPTAEHVTTSMNTGS